MTRSTRGAFVIAVVFFTLAGLALVPRSAAAQASTTASESAPVTSTAGKPATAAAAVVHGGQLIAFVAVGAGFATIVLLILFVYMYAIQRRYYEVVERAGASGASFKTTWVAPFVQANIAAAGQAAQISIKGPAAVNVGALSEEFSLEGDPTAAQQAQWSVDPPGAAAVVPDHGPIVKVVPASVGAFKLVATVAGQGVTAHVAATTPHQNQTDLPFVGGGYGAVLVAVVLLIVVATLAVGGVLGAETVGTLLGGLLGYVFGATQGTRRDEKPAEQPRSS
jgi:hypothetical protein